MFNPLSLVERRIRTFDTVEVTRRNRGAEVRPSEVGLTDRGVAAMWGALEKLYETRLYPAVGLTVRRRGQVIIDGVIGHERGNAPSDDPHAPLVQATPQTRFGLFSASKAITACVIHKLDDLGLLQVDDRVCEFIPEFAQHGKERITIKQVLTHRAGMPSIPVDDVGVSLLADWDRIVRVICAAKPVLAPGRRVAYHALTGGFILGEIVRRVTGRDIRTVLHEDILKPAGITDMSLGVPASEVDRVALNAFSGAPSVPPFSTLFKRALGVSVEEATELSNHPLFLTGIIPSGNVIATSDACTLFFELLLRGGILNGNRVFEERTVRRAVAATTSFLEFDLTLSLPVRYGMGFMLGARRLSCFGPNTRQAFGHLGFTGVVTYADPERDVSVSLMNTGKPFIHSGISAWFGVMNTIANEVPRDGRSPVWAR